MCIVPEVIEIKEHYDEIDDNGAYFQKVVGEEVTLDDNYYNINIKSSCPTKIKEHK